MICSAKGDDFELLLVFYVVTFDSASRFYCRNVYFSELPSGENFEPGLYMSMNNIESSKSSIVECIELMPSGFAYFIPFLTFIY